MTAIAIARFRVPINEQADFAVKSEIAIAALAECEGFLSGDWGTNTDEPDLMVVVTRWRDIGSYRRALGKNPVKMSAIPLLALAIDEPGAYIE